MKKIEDIISDSSPNSLIEFHNILLEMGYRYSEKDSDKHRPTFIR